MSKKKFMSLVVGLLLIFTISYALLSLSPITQDEVESPSYQIKDVAKYTYISYVCADNNLEPYGRMDINEMELGYNDSQTDVHVISLLDLPGGGDTVAYYISYDNDPGSITSTQLVIPGFGSERNMGDPDTLITYVNFSMTYYPAEHYILDLWDHGSGWEICFDDTSGGDALTMAELRYALETINATTGNTIDILAMDACLMGTLEVAYELHEYASILVASEDAILALGFPYDDIIADLCDAPNQNITEFATTIVDLFHAASFPILSSQLSAVNLSLVNSSVFPSFANLAVNLYDYLDDGIKNELYNARIDSEYFYDPDYIDLYDFVQNTYNEATNLPSRQLASDLMANITPAIIHEKHYINPGAHGLSIYFPRYESSYLSSYSTFFSSSNDSMWDEFLVKYYDTANFGLNLRYYQINATPDPGATILIDIELENIGEFEAGFVNGTLFCLDTENITVLDDFQAYGNITTGSSTTKSFVFNISGGCEINHVLPFVFMTEAIFDTGIIYDITRNFTLELIVGRQIIFGGSTRQTATEIFPDNLTYSALPGPGEDGVSWFKISCTANLYLFLNLTGPILTDFDAYVYDPDGQLASIAGKATYPDICSLMLLQNGYYYIKLEPFSGHGYFEMYVNITTEAYEDGLGFGTAFTVSGISTTNGTLPGPESSNYLFYRVIVLAGQRINVELEGEAGTDFDLYIYNPNLDEVCDSTSPSSSESCTLRASSTGYYYIVLVRYSGSGEFTLDVQVQDANFPLWLLILIVIIVAIVVVAAIAFYLTSARKSQDLASAHYDLSDIEI